MNTHSTGQGCMNIQGLPGNELLLFWDLKTEGSHIVQSVGQFDENHPDIIGHGENHLPDAFRLAFLGTL